MEKVIVAKAQGVGVSHGVGWARGSAALFIWGDWGANGEARLELSPDGGASFIPYRSFNSDGVVTLPMPFDVVVRLAVSGTGNPSLNAVLAPVSAAAVVASL